jgi:hypothetical protein
MPLPRTQATVSQQIALDDQHFDDEPFDVDAVEAGAWVPGPYGPDDQLGTFNEVTPAKTAAALAMLDTTRAVTTFNLSETLFNGFPAIGTREYEQRLQISGFQPRPGFEGIVNGTEPHGNNRISTFEERVSLTYNMGTKINGLHHCGVGNMFYNGFRGDAIAETWGSNRLGTDGLMPIVTRGVLLDVLALKLDDDTSVVDEAPNGNPHLRSNYRITVDDLQQALERASLSSPIEPGDVILIRTGWRQLIQSAPERYINDLVPGPFLRETRWLGSQRPAIIGIDVWCYGVLDPAVDGGRPCICHQELFMRFGVRIGEAVPSDNLAEAGVHEFVFCFNAQRAMGAVAGNAPPFALAQPAGRA